jgi:hypothetical protein
MKFTIAREEEFIPKWNDNEKSDSPIKFILNHLNVIDREGLLAITYDDEGKPRFKADNIKACKLGIKRIENLIVNETSIENALQFLASPGLHELAMEVGAKIITMNAVKNEADRKN